MVIIYNSINIVIEKHFKMSIFFRNKGEEPTAKDSMIKDQKDRLDQLHKLYKEMYSECRELLREKTSLQLELSQLKGKVDALEGVFLKWKEQNKELNKNINLNKLYDGIQEY